MITIMKYSPENKNEWNEFLHQAKNNLFMFDRNYMEYHSDRFTDHSLMFYKEKSLVALLPANQEERTLFTHGGLTYGGFISGDTMKQETMMECFDELKVYCRNSNINKVLYKVIPYFYHLQPAEEDKFALFYNKARIRKVEASTVIDLQRPIHMAKLRCRQIKKAEKSGLIVVVGNEFEDYQDYIELVDTVLQENHSVKAVHTADELYLLYNRFPENIHLYMAKLNNILVAGTVLFEYRDVIHTQYLATNDDGRKIGALDLTINEVINHYVYRKKYLDFGISTENAGKYLNKGLISQKEGFGGRTVVYETWELDI